MTKNDNTYRLPGVLNRLKKPRAVRTVIISTMALGCMGQVFLTPAAAQQSPKSPKNLSEVFSVMQAKDGIMSPQLHRILWEDLKRQIGNDPAEIKRFWSLVEKNSNYSSARFNYEAGLSAIASLRGSKISKTREFDRAAKRLLAAMKKAGDRASIQKSFAKWNNSLTKLAAARFNPKIANHLRAMESFDQLVSTSQRELHNLNVMRKLSFGQVVTDNRYASLTVSIRWHGVFQFEASSVREGKSKPVRVVSLSDQFHDNSVAKVILYRIRVPKKYRLARAGAIAKGWMQTFGVRNGRTGRQKWRGMDSIRARGKCKYQGAACDLELRSVTLPRQQGVLIFAAFSLTGQSKADQLFQMLDSAIKLTRVELICLHQPIVRAPFPTIGPGPRDDLGQSVCHLNFSVDGQHDEQP